jgi:uncharacterized protein (TIGR02284 family)
MQDYTALKDVIATCRAAEQGFRGAANAAKTPMLRGMFEQYSIQRGEFANELLRASRGLGLNVGNPYGLSGMLHAGWMELKGALTGHSDRQILEECERGEEYALDTYRQSLRLNIHPEVRDILQRQISDIENARVHIGTLIDTFVRESADDQTHKAA